MVLSDGMGQGAAVCDWRVDKMYRIPALLTDEHDDAKHEFELKALADCLASLTQSRSDRISATLATLPRVQNFLLRFLGAVLVGSFVFLRDAGDSQQLTESLLTGILVTIFVLMECIIEDLRDPFDGFWSIAPASEALTKLRNNIAAMKKGDDGGGRAEEVDDVGGGARRPTMSDVAAMLLRKKQG